MLTWFLKGILVLGFLIIVGRLLELQVIKGNYFLELSEGNRIRRVPINAPRGEIHARGGEILAENKKVLKKLKFGSKGFEKVDEPDLKEDEDTSIEWEREYKLKDRAAHITGYVGKVGPEELGKVNPACPDKGIRDADSVVGRSGLEEYYECELSGIAGEDLFEVDSKGSLVRRLGRRPAVPGKNIVTNIVYGLQERVADVMQDKIGGVVVTDVRGEVLALYSSPSYDPNFLVVQSKSNEVQKLIEDSGLPFFNRVVSGLYHPGSVFKPIVASAALQEGKVDKNFKYEDTGEIVVKAGDQDFSYKNWFFTQYGSTEGFIDVKRALARSTDTFFYKVGEFLGPDKISQWAGNFGMQDLTGIDIPSEAQDLVPTPAWKKSTKGESWFLGNTYHFAIGQGDLAVTPLSMNMATKVLVDGMKCTPKLVGETECREIGLDEGNRKVVLEGMRGACSQGGTASVFFDFNPKVACKTGTAQTGVNDKTHAWFTVIAPSDGGEFNESQVIMTALVEEGGEGSVVAAPIAKNILSYWFSQTN